MASFQAIIGWNRPRNRENENYHSVSLQPDAQYKIAKKLKKHSYGFFSSKIWLEKAEKERKQKLSFRFFITRRINENSKKIEKKFGKLKNIIVAHFKT